MPAPLTLINTGFERWYFRRRLLVTAGALLLLAGLLVARLGQLQVVEHDHYRTLSQENRVRLLPVPPTRGSIYSADGELLATNRPSYTLDIIPEQIGDLETTLADLQQIVAIDEHELRRYKRLRSQRRRFENVSIKVNLGDAEAARFAVVQHEFPGVVLNTRVVRDYPAGELFAHLVGYVARVDQDDLDAIKNAGNLSDYAGTTHIGRSGLERMYESSLHGGVGYRQVEVNAEGRVLRVLSKESARPGKDLFLSIDAALQRRAAELLASRRGAVVAIDPNTGGLLAMVSQPSFNPNLFVDGISVADYGALRDSPDRPLYDRALRGQYPPGSTIKPMVGLAGLASGERRVAEQTFCRGFYTLPNHSHRYRDWKKHGHGHTDLTKAIAESCDVYFYDLARDLGIEGMAVALKDFGLGVPTGIDLPSEPKGLVPDPEWKRRAHDQPWYGGETLISGIGQGYTLVTPLQLAVATSTLARRGIVVRPHVVDVIEDPTTGAVYQTPVDERIMGLPAPPEQWDSVIAAMVEVVHGLRGTARKIGVDLDYQIAGKTGTAQVFTIAQDQDADDLEVAEHLKDHALFVAFAPADAPRIALAIIVENGGSGSGTAAPLARTLIRQYLEGSAATAVRQVPIVDARPPT